METMMFFLYPISGDDFDGIVEYHDPDEQFGSDGLVESLIKWWTGLDNLDNNIDDPVVAKMLA